MAKSKLSFKSAVEKAANISGALQQGLKALGANSSRIKATDPKLINGSVDIDETLKAAYYHDSRWDYVIGYNEKAFFVEVHPADTSNVDEMIKKVVWLKEWLKISAPDLQMLNESKVYHWIPSGRVRILKSSPQYKKIAKNNLKLTEKLMVLK